MRTFVFAITSITAITVVLAACKKDDPATTPVAPTQTAYGPGPYPTQPGPYPTQPGPYPTQPGYPTAPPPTTAPPAGTMGTEGIIPCTADMGCGFGKCNPQTQKCVFPCKSTELDCQAGHTCNPNGFCF